jgi:hypothetical protein
MSLKHAFKSIVQHNLEKVSPEMFANFSRLHNPKITDAPFSMLMSATIFRHLSMKDRLVLTGIDIQSFPFEVRREKVDSAASEAVASLLGTPPTFGGRAPRGLMGKVRRPHQSHQHSRIHDLDQITGMTPRHGVRKCLRKNVSAHPTCLFVYHPYFLHLTHFM